MVTLEEKLFPFRKGMLALLDGFVLKQTVIVLQRREVTFTSQWSGMSPI